MEIDTNYPITLTPYKNGGWTVTSGSDMRHMTIDVTAAFSNSNDMLVALRQLLSD